MLISWSQQVVPLICSWQSEFSVLVKMPKSELGLGHFRHGTMSNSKTRGVWRTNDVCREAINWAQIHQSNFTCCLLRPDLLRDFRIAALFFEFLAAVALIMSKLRITKNLPVGTQVSVLCILCSGGKLCSMHLKKKPVYSHGNDHKVWSDGKGWLHWTNYIPGVGCKYPSWGVFVTFSQKKMVGNQKAVLKCHRKHCQVKNCQSCTLRQLFVI